MKFKEEIKDLFSVEQGYCLAHCISADFALGAGIALVFDEKYNMRERLKNNDIDLNYVGNVIQIDNVYNLITKEKAYEKPSYDSLIECLKELKDRMIENKQYKIAMPKIGCGLDKLDWQIVRALIKDIFSDTEIEILICLNPEEYEEKDINKVEENEREDNRDDFSLTRNIDENKAKDAWDLFIKSSFGI